jgi:sec-independent protein translocase protein TatA
MGFWELLLILFVVLLFFGAGKLAGVGAGLGKAARGFKDAVKPDRPAPPPGQAPPAAPRELPPEGPKA